MLEGLLVELIAVIALSVVIYLYRLAVINQLDDVFGASILFIQEEKGRWFRRGVGLGEGQIRGHFLIQHDKIAKFLEEAAAKATPEDPFIRIKNQSRYNALVSTMIGNASLLFPDRIYSLVDKMEGKTYERYHGEDKVLIVLIKRFKTDDDLSKRGINKLTAIVIFEKDLLEEFEEEIDVDLKHFGTREKLLKELKEIVVNSPREKDGNLILQNENGMVGFTLMLS